MKQTKQTKKEFFKECVKKYAKRLIPEYEIMIGFGNVEGRAECSTNLTARIITIYADEKWIKKENTSNIEIEKTAFHEILETVMCELSCPLLEMYSKNYVDEKTHTIIRKLENLFFSEDQIIDR